ncbi:hypothetical protein C8R45DRAFT_858483 [Mycena sanguinolenta]|nr:hypothetical protein C8R45DRAFT_858483 [Mycena sanguinolenta]
MSDASLSPPDSSSSSCSSPSEASSPRLVILSKDLPLPTAPRPFSTKKSHAKKQPLGHIPRPRNAFILFRCDYSRQNERKSGDCDQNDVSREVGTIWRNMTREQRAPWVVLAEAEKKKHAELYPGYKYMPRNRQPKPTEREVDNMIAREAEKVAETEAVERATKANSRDMVTVYYPPWATRRTLTYFARRATSCPPDGAVRIEPYSEMVERSMVTIAKAESKEEVPAQENQPKEVQPQSNTPSKDVFVPEEYDIRDGDGSCSDTSHSRSISADRSLSQDSYNIDPPGGTSSWGEKPPSPTDYPPIGNTQYAFPQPFNSPCIPPFSNIVQQREFMMSQYYHGALQPSRFDNQVAYQNHWSVSSSSTAASGEILHVEPPTEHQEGFLSEFADLPQPSGPDEYNNDRTFGNDGVSIPACESSIRTTYSPTLCEGLLPPDAGLCSQ